MRLVYDRKTGGDIARALKISKSTVESHLAQARRTLGVSRSVEAAELFHAYEQRIASCDPTTYSAPLPAEAIDPASEPTGRPSWWRAALPLRSAGAERNDLSSIQRLFAVFVVALGAAVGFGSLASGLHAINDLIRRIGAP